MDSDEITQLRDTWRSCFYPATAAVDEAFADLVKRYSERHRHYHTFRHIFKVVTTAESLFVSMKVCNLIKAAFLHDVIYDTHANDNEERSAEFARELLAGLRNNRINREETARLILLTKTHEASITDLPGCALLDADLAILSEGVVTYDAYAAAIRKEYDWVPEEQYREGRRRVLERFLTRRRIYHTPAFLGREESARVNLSREIASLS